MLKSLNNTVNSSKVLIGELRFKYTVNVLVRLDVEYHIFPGKVSRASKTVLHYLLLCLPKPPAKVKFIFRVIITRFSMVLTLEPD